MLVMMYFRAWRGVCMVWFVMGTVASLWVMASVCISCVVCDACRFGGYGVGQGCMCGVPGLISVVFGGRLCFEGF